MGIVKFGQQRLSIEQIPDGHEVISESELASIRQGNNSYLSLKSRIPVGVNESQLTDLLEKGQRYEGINGELNTTKTELQTTKQKVQSFANMPQDFSLEKWNNDRKNEQRQIREQKYGVLEKKVLDRVEQKFHFRPEIDKRFIPADQLESLNLEATDAEDKLYVILEGAHDAQLQFIKEGSTKFNNSSPKVGATEGSQQGDGGSPPAGAHQSQTGNKIGPDGVAVGGF